ncbi:MAG: hypothetical protein ABSD29_19945 [Verrucomicrobiota bacterium]|jgi:S1-C subfamily serine protease
MGAATPPRIEAKWALRKWSLVRRGLADLAPLANGGNVSGATAATLTPAPVTEINVGNYAVAIGNPFLPGCVGAVTAWGAPEALRNCAVVPGAITWDAGATKCQ